MAAREEGSQSFHADGVKTDKFGPGFLKWMFVLGKSVDQLEQRLRQVAGGDRLRDAVSCVQRTFVRGIFLEWTGNRYEKQRKGTNRRILVATVVNGREDEVDA